MMLKSETFRRLWGRHDVGEKTSGTQRFVHPLVAELSLGYESFAIGGAPGRIRTARADRRANARGDQRTTAAISSCRVA